MARALGRSTSASALLEGTLRSFQEKPLILGKRANSRGDAPTLFAFARRHPDQFQRDSLKDESASFPSGPRRGRPSKRENHEDGAIVISNCGA